MSEAFEQSKAAGCHAVLARMAGTWAGETRTWFQPGVLADTSPWRGRIRTVLGGRFAVHEYEGSVQGERLEGIAILGCDLGRGRAEISWVDSAHNGTAQMYATGTATPRGLSVLGGYRDPSGGPDWGWRTEVDLVDADHLVIRMWNIPPGGPEALAVEVRYERGRD